MGKKNRKKNRNKKKNKNFHTQNNNNNGGGNNKSFNDNDNNKNNNQTDRKSESPNQDYVTLGELNVNAEDYTHDGTSDYAGNVAIDGATEDYTNDTYVSDDDFNSDSKDDYKNRKDKKSNKEAIHFAEQIEKPQSSSKTISTYSLAILFAIIITALIASATGVVKLPNVSEYFARNGDNAEELNESSDELQVDDFYLDDNQDAVISESRSEKTFAGQATTLRLPMLLSDSNGYDISGTQLDCDVIVWVEQDVPLTRAPLNATYQALFAFGQELDFYIGNYVGNQSNLNFERVAIENRVAKVYLTGEVDAFEGVCDENRLANQITIAATQFSTVDDAEIYLNGELY